MGYRSRNRTLSLELQVAAMRELFPQFKYERIGKWTGILKPSNASVEYTLSLCYNPPYTPMVFVLHPDLASDAPHRYRNDSLCLYDPKEGSWTANKLIAKTIMLWAAEWLFFYEIWLKTGIWFGPEAPHTGNKK
jgi:hypothetical protein